MTAKEIRAGMVITVLAATVNLLPARATVIVLQPRPASAACVKRPAMIIRAQIQSIRHVRHREKAISVNAPHPHAVADTNAKRPLRAFRMIKTLPIRDCAKCCRPKAARRTKTVQRKRNAATDIASSANRAPKTPIALLTNGVAKTVTASYLQDWKLFSRWSPVLPQTVGKEHAPTDTFVAVRRKHAVRQTFPIVTERSLTTAPAGVVRKPDISTDNGSSLIVDTNKKQQPPKFGGCLLLKHIQNVFGIFADSVD